MSSFKCFNWWICENPIWSNWFNWSSTVLQIEWDVGRGGSHPARNPALRSDALVVQLLWRFWKPPGPPSPCSMRAVPGWWLSKYKDGLKMSKESKQIFGLDSQILHEASCLWISLNHVHVSVLPAKPIQALQALPVRSSAARPLSERWHTACHDMALWCYCPCHAALRS